MNGEKLKNQLKIDIDPQILQEALYHLSFLNEKRRSNNEIEIQKSYIHLGKLIYQLALSTFIAEEETKQNKELYEKLTQYKEEILVQFYDKYKLNDLLYIGKGELNDRKERYLDHGLMILYHIYKETGFDRLRKILLPLYKKSKKVDKLIDYKSVLMEYIQKLKLSADSIKYETIQVEGPAHDCMYTVKVSANGLSGVGRANSKKKAQQQAAQNWFEKNKVAIPSKQKKKSVQHVKTLEITKNREAELKQVYKTLKLTSKDLSVKNLDICFTHKSFANEKRLSSMETITFYAWFGSLVIPFLIGEYIVQDFQSRASGKNSRLIELTGSLVSKNHLNTCLPDSVFKSVRITNKNELKVPSLRADLVQTIVGAIFLQNLENHNENVVENIKPFVQTFIISTFEEDSESVDYRSYLQIVTQELKMETKAKLAKLGPAHQVQFEVKVATFFANGEKFLEGRGKASSKKQSINLACKEIIERMIHLYHLNNKKLELPNKTIINQTMAYYTRNAINHRNPIKFLEIVGGLCLNRWSLATAVNIVTHLYKRGLISELLMLFMKWEKLYSLESVESCIRQLPDKIAKEAIRSEWQATIIKREELKNIQESEMEDEFLLLFDEFDFKPVADPNYIIGKIAVKENKHEDDKVEVKTSQDEGEAEEFEEIDDLFNFVPSP